MTLLAENTAGMHNLFRLSSRSSLEGFFYKPRADRELLSEYATGLIATTGCPSGEIQTWLRIGDYDKARASAAEFRDIFGAGNFFLELMDHGLDIQKRVQEDLLKLGRDLALPMIATNDLHYTHAADADTHDILLCVQSGKTMADPGRFKFDARDFYLKTPAEMRSLWADKHDLPEACDNTLLIAERCDVTFAEGANYMPRFPVPAGEDENSWFVKEVEKGLLYRYPGGIPAEVRKQADYEVGVIIQMGFPGYFLVVADFINWAKDNGIRVGPGRGSGAGSMAAYAMRITDLDPLRHGLIFERFLNPDRVSMPDFDIDFDERRRGEVIRYVSEKYGDDRVAQIVTYGTIKAKQAVKDAARVLGYPFSMGDRITKVMPAPVMGKDVPLAKIFDTSDKRYGEGAEFRALYDADVEVKRVVDQAKGLEGLKRQWGVHAAGVIMSSEPLIDLIPIMKRELDGAIITQFDYPTCEKLGLIKMDFLGLRNLTVLDDALRNITANRGETIVLEELELDDPLTFELLARGDTLGVFQLDGGPMRALLRSMRPDKFEDISAVGALYRPGPMGMNSHNEYADRKNNRKPVVAIHPELADPLGEILGETYGLIVYQEQVMAVAQKVAGYSLGGADLLRRAMGKKKKSELDAQYETFNGGMKERGFSEGGRQGALGHAAAVLGLRVQQGAFGRLRRHLVLDRVPQGELPGRIHGRAADLRARRQGQVRDLPGRVPADGHQGAAAGRQRIDRRLHPDRHRHPVRVVGRAQRRGERRRLDRGVPYGQGRVHRLRRLPAQGRCGRLQQADDRGADQGGRIRLARARASRAADGLRAGRRCRLDTKRNEANGQFDLFGFGDLESALPSGVDVRRARHRR